MTQGSSAPLSLARYTPPPTGFHFRRNLLPAVRFNDQHLKHDKAVLEAVSHCVSCISNIKPTFRMYMNSGFMRRQNFEQANMRLQSTRKSEVFSVESDARSQPALRTASSPGAAMIVSPESADVSSTGLSSCANRSILRGAFTMI